jgi:hypothetical protein
MAAHEILQGLLRAYVGGDLLARRALLDYLEETGDGRAAAVQQEAIDWDAVAGGLPLEVRRSFGTLLRFYIDCARFNSDTVPQVMEAVRAARRQWLHGLFPEVDLSAGDGCGTKESSS